ncbi:hypothetical protein [Legionella bozemanae]|uniref:hypothetical protein n=1 Tax=Legionella bozemanae TaxID=447 RepID=UPI0010418F3B|nr:hypothetical protein [Legionella bozemanae]
MIHKSEKRVVKKLINDVKKVYGKDTILFNIAEICLKQPDGTIRDKIFPIIGQDKLKNIIDEYKKKGQNTKAFYISKLEALMPVITDE